MIDKELQALTRLILLSPSKALTSAVETRCEELNAEAAGITLAKYREIRIEERDKH